MMKSPSFRTYMLLSLIVHVLFVGTMLIVEKVSTRPAASEAVSISFLSPEELQQLDNAEKAVQKKSYVSKNQIVEQNPQTNDEVAPPDARFLSAKNQKVEKQSVAKERGEFQNLQKATSTSGPKGDGKKKAVAKSLEARQQIERDLFKGFNASEALDRQRLAEQEAGLGQGQGRGDENNGTGKDASKTNDYIKDVNVGLETLLNTREFKYYSYYNRIRKQLSQHWEGRVREKLSKLFKEGRSPAATNKDRVTKLMIVLNDAGTLVRVQVLSDSGVRDLDEAAIEAFRAAAPFPNPPEGIVESDGTVKIRWDFVLEV